MSRLSEDIIANVDIVDVVSRYVQLKRVGRNFVGLSQFRNEKTPSFTVSPEKQIFKCFSTWIWWNVIKFIMEIEKIDYRDAAQILAKDASIDIKEYQKKTSPAQQEKREKQGEEKEKYKLMLRLAQQYFLDELAKSNSAQHYLHEKRNLTDTVIQAWWVWYAPDSSFWLPKLLLGKWFSEADCEQIGLAKKGQSGDMYSFYRNRITFPIFDHMGTLVGFGARAINPDDQPKYLNSPDSQLYDKSKILYWLDQAKNTIKTHDKLVVVEWYMDVIWANRLIGAPIAVATCGTSLTPNHMKLLKRYTTNIFFLFDNDPAWMQASLRALKIAYQQDMYPKVLLLPSSVKDIDERANTQPSEEEKQKFFDEAIDGFLGVMHQEAKRADLQNPVERKRFLQTMFEVLMYIEDWTILTWYLEELGKYAGINYDMLFSQYKSFTRTQTITLAHAHKEKELSNKKPMEKSENLFNAFFYGTFLHDNGVLNSTVDEAMILVVELAGLIDDEILLRVVSGDVGEAYEDIAQSQLRWETHREWFDEEKKKAEVLHHCRKYLQTALRQINKENKISGAEKQDLMKRVQELK